ncbi:MAG: hypothetical protein ACRBFS_05750 [Aureispira sp.]
MKQFLFLPFLLALLCVNSCQTTRLSSKKLEQVVQDRVALVFDRYVQELVEERAFALAENADLDSNQVAQLLDLSQWEHLIQARRDSVKNFANQQLPSRQEKEQFCACIDQKSKASSCQDLLVPIANKTGTQIDQLVSPFEFAFTKKALDNNWVPSNTTRKNCASLHTGLFYYHTPFQKMRVEVDRYESGQTEVLRTKKSTYKIVWDQYNKYRIIQLNTSQEFEAAFEILQVHPTYYIFKCPIPYDAENPDYVIGRLYRAEKKS